MQLKTIFFLLTAFIMACCNEPNKTKMNTTDKNAKEEAANRVPNKKITAYAPVNGIKMYYEIHGNGSPLVLIHGGGSTFETSFGKILPYLANHFKVIGVELQAHGHTSDRNSPESFEQDADDVAALLKFLKIDKSNLFGFSNGGTTAMQIAIRHGELVNKLVIASAIYKRSGMIPGFFEGMKEASLNNMPQPLQDAFLKINNDTAKLQVMHDKDKQRMLEFKDWKGSDLEKIKAPTLIINADKDVVVTEHALEMSRLIRGAELLILPGVHGSYIGEICSPSPDTKTIELTASVIQEFLNKK